MAAFAVRHQFLREDEHSELRSISGSFATRREKLGVFAIEGADVRALAVEINTGVHHLESPFDPASLLPGASARGRRDQETRFVMASTKPFLHSRTGGVSTSIEHPQRFLREHFVI